MLFVKEYLEGSPILVLTNVQRNESDVMDRRQLSLRIINQWTRLSCS